MYIMGFSGGLDNKESACNVKDPGLIPGSGRSPGEGNGDPLEYSCLENFMDTAAWWATVHGIPKSWISYLKYILYNIIIYYIFIYRYIVLS